MPDQTSALSLSNLCNTPRRMRPPYPWTLLELIPIIMIIVPRRFVDKSVLTEPITCCHLCRSLEFLNLQGHLAVTRLVHTSAIGSELQFNIDTEYMFCEEFVRDSIACNYYSTQYVEGSTRSAAAAAATHPQHLAYGGPSDHPSRVLFHRASCPTMRVKY